ATVKQGLRLASGSWKIIAMSLPVSALRSAADSDSSSRPANTMRRARTRPGKSTSPISASAVTLLPEPDSPTQPTISPASIVRSTSSTAVNGATTLPNSTVRPSISSKAMRLSLELRVEGVAQAVAHQVELQHGDQDRQAGEGDDPRCPLDELERVGQHRSPLRRRRLRAQAEESECGGVEDRVGKAECRLHDQRSGAIGQERIEQQPQCAGAGEARRRDVLFGGF